MKPSDRAFLKAETARTNTWYRIRRVKSELGNYREFPMFGGLQYGEHAVLLSEGGWARKWMTTKELRAARERWIAESYSHEGPAFHEALREYGGVIQCGGCRFFAAFDADFGLCANPASWFDGRVTFEHGGCLKHSKVEDGTVAWNGKDVIWRAEKEKDCG